MWACDRKSYSDVGELRCGELDSFGPASRCGPCKREVGFDPFNCRADQHTCGENGAKVLVCDRETRVSDSLLPISEVSFPFQDVVSFSCFMDNVLFWLLIFRMMKAR